jgi:NAD-dependent SIR2 family protein deacetylase
MLQQWAKRMRHGSRVFTSNVDGQFQRAGFDSDRIHECHGSIHYLQCLNACSTQVWSADTFAPDVDAVACRLRNSAPLCPRCGALARPNILMFGDGQWIEQRSAEQAARQQAWLATVRRPVVIEIGAGTAIPSVRHFSRRVVQQYGGRLIRINPTEAGTGGDGDVGLAMGGKAGLEVIGRVLGAEWG